MGQTRDGILNWVFRNGERQAAMVANQNSLGFRAAIRETAKVYGMPADEIGVMSARVSRQQAIWTFPLRRPRRMAQPALPDLAAEGTVA